jgi:hypothetical protein
LTTGSLGAWHIGTNARANTSLAFDSTKQSRLRFFKYFDVGVTGADPEDLEGTLGGLI